MLTPHRKQYFSRTEKFLWLASVICCIISFLIFEGKNVLYLVASIIGITSLIFNAKGNPVGQFLMIIFSIIYGIISFSYHYYGEMITYLGMTGPMAFVALISWLRNPYKGNKSEVTVNSIGITETILLSFLTIITTYVFFFILRFFNTENLILSTLSVATSFVAVYLTFRRSPYFALAYSANDIVLICLWILASASDKSYISVVICFIMFFVNDLYGFINWKKIKNRQMHTN